MCYANDLTNLARIPKSFFIGICVYLLLLQNLVLSTSLNLSNDGPGVSYTNLTIYATLIGGNPSKKYEYELKYENEEINRTVSGLNATFVVNMNPRIYKKRTYRMEVKVFDEHSFKIIPIARNTTDFNVTDKINGKINVSNLVLDKFIAVNSTVNFTYIIHDPSGYFNNSNIQYLWRIGDDTTYTNPSPYNVTTEGPMRVSVTAISSKMGPSGTEYLWGLSEKKVHALRGVNNINITGNVYLKKGDVVSLDLKCNGSSPFKYCWQIFGSDASATAIQNMSCDPVTYSQCSFHFQHYFPLVGKYSIGTLVGNNLGLIQRTINLEIYDVSTRSQLSIVIIPIACSIIGMLIIVIGITYHIHQRRAYVIEVADFDFHQPTELSEKTFMERVKESFKTAVESLKHPSTEMIDDTESVNKDQDDNGSACSSSSNGRTNLLPHNYGTTA